MTKKRSKRDDAPLMADLFDLPVLSNPPEMNSPAAPAAPTPPTAKSEKRARKPFKIFHPRKAKNDRTYDRAEVMDLYDVTRNTVTNWIDEGLVTVPVHPVLFRGEDLNAFHQARRVGARRNCSPGEFLCFHCKKVSSLKRGSSGSALARRACGHAPLVVPCLWQAERDLPVALSGPDSGSAGSQPDLQQRRLLSFSPPR